MPTVLQPELALENQTFGGLSVNLLPQVAPEQSLGERAGGFVRSIGTRAVEGAQGLFNKTKSSLESGKKRTAAYVAMGVLALNVAYESGNLIMPESVTAKSSPSKITKKSRMKNQSVLNMIHDALKPGDYAPSGHRVKPTSAYLRAEAGGFTTDCKDPAQVTFENFRLANYGLIYKTCGPLGVLPRKAKPSEFSGSLDKIGKKIELSAGFNFRQHAKSISGNRRRVVTLYNCPPVGGDISEPGVSETKGVKRIVMIRARKNATKSAITMC